MYCMLAFLFISLSCFLLPVPHIHSSLWGALAGCDLCGQTSQSFLATSPAAVPGKMRATLTASCPENINKVTIMYSKKPPPITHLSLQVYLSEAVDSVLHGCQLIGYCYTVDFCLYKRPQELVGLSVLTSGIRPVSKRETIKVRLG